MTTDDTQCTVGKTTFPRVRPALRGIRAARRCKTIGIQKKGIKKPACGRLLGDGSD